MGVRSAWFLLASVSMPSWERRGWLALFPLSTFLTGYCGLGEGIGNTESSPGMLCGKRVAVGIFSVPGGELYGLRDAKNSHMLRPKSSAIAHVWIRGDLLISVEDTREMTWWWRFVAGIPDRRR